MEKIKEIIIGNSEITEEEKVKLIKELERLKANQKDKRYGLVWENHPEDVELLRETHTYKVEELKELEIKEVEGQKPNLILEGDNLHSLEVLRDSGVKVDVIYIDPPYNTLNETGFAYNDKKVDSNDNFRHSKWLSFMEKRLKLARQLMTDEGVIFVSIDDNEQAQLKLLMDQVFGEQNFVSKIVWHNNKAGRQLDKYFANTYEEIMCYKKNNLKIKPMFEEQEQGGKYQEEDKVSRYRRGSALYNSNSKFNYKTRPNLVYTIYYKEGYDFEPIRDIGVVGVKEEDVKKGEELKERGYIPIQPPIRDNGTGMGCWRWGIAKVKKEGVSELIVYQRQDGTYMLYTKDRLKGDYKERKPKNYITDLGQTSGEDLKEIFGGQNVFYNPKPVKLIKWIVERVYVGEKGLTVLDFFAGSGTTGHAVMELNKEDGGNRRFILCTNNEYQESKKVDIIHKHTDVVIDTKKNGEPSVKGKEQLQEFEGTEEYQELVNKGLFEEIGICRAVTYERNKRVIKGYTTPKGKEIEGLPNNLKYYRVGLIPKEDISELDYINYNSERLEKEIEIKEGIPSFENKGLYSISETKDKVYVVCKEIYLPREVVGMLQAEERDIELYVTKEIMYIDYNISKLKEEKGTKIEVKPIKEILK